ncbi:hypothetical protein HDU91_007489 [Kappamyces sp. JEL0680]|nr:hypothetical protein HDU91_007489 [Kappamyces sp. JEL0680]
MMAVAINSFCVPNKICIYGRPDGGSQSVTFTIQSAGEGWASVGVGKDMLGLGTGTSKGVIYVGWKSPGGDIKFSTRVPSGNLQPPMSTAQVAKVVPTDTSIPVPPWAKLVFSFSRPFLGPTSVIASNSTFIWAFSQYLPFKPDDLASNFVAHDPSTRGVFASDFTSASAAGPVPSVMLFVFLLYYKLFV